MRGADEIRSRRRPNVIRRASFADLLLAMLLAAGTVGYLAALPRGAVGIDEATYLKEALRLMRGEVLYRDVFDLTTPGWMYLMALLFNTFGATFATARITAAVIQAATALMVFATCRSVGVRREIAIALAVVCVLSAEVNYRVASQHWLATLLSAGVLLTYVRSGQTRAGVFATGVIVGILISVHQQRGLSMALGAAMFVSADALLTPPADRPILRTLVRRGLTLAVGVSVVVGPMLALSVWQAGFAPVWRSLVTFPLVDYRHSAHCPWGFDSVRGSVPAEILKWLPVVPLLAGIRIAVLWRQHSPHLRAWLIMSLHGAASILSIWYYPDRIHIAFIVPSFAVLAGALIEWLLRGVGERVSGVDLERFSPSPLTPSLRLAASQALGYVLTLALIVPSLVLARGYFNERWRVLNYPYWGPFGRIDFPNPESVEFHTRLARLLDDVPGRTLYCYLTMSYTCLFVDGHNPTRFELLVVDYNSPAQIAEVTHMLTLKDVPYVIALPAAVQLDDPIAAFIRRNYVQIERGEVVRAIWRRKVEPGQSVD